MWKFEYTPLPVLGNPSEPIAEEQWWTITDGLQFFTTQNGASAVWLTDTLNKMETK